MTAAAFKDRTAESCNKFAAFTVLYSQKSRVRSGLRTKQGILRNRVAPAPTAPGASAPTHTIFLVGPYFEIFSSISQIWVLPYLQVKNIGMTEDVQYNQSKIND